MDIITSHPLLSIAATVILTIIVLLIVPKLVYKINRIAKGGITNGKNISSRSKKGIKCI